MTLLERLYEDMKAAMKSGDKDRLGVLRMTIAAIKKDAIDGGAALDEAQEIAVLQRAVKQRRESAEAFTNGGRPELAAREQREGEILAEYLPQQVSGADLDEAVRALIAETGASSPRDVGKVMGPLLQRFKGRLDGTRAREAVQKQLAGD